MCETSCTQRHDWQAADAARHTYDKKIQKVRDQSHTKDPYLFVAGFGLTQVGQCEQSQPQRYGQDLGNIKLIMHV